MMKKSLNLFLLLTVMFVFYNCEQTNQDKNFRYKVGLLGAPSYTDVEWNDHNMLLMKQLGFNAMQLNIAWGIRPADNPLILEDVIPVPQEYLLPVDVDSTINQNVGYSKTFIHAPHKIAARAAELKHRIDLCKKHGMRTIFHFGAPFVAYPAIEPLSQCISDPFTTKRYVRLIEDFYKEFPGVDDLLLYTYDQNAWLCSEDGPCEKCSGVPLDVRVASFVNTLAATWKRLNADGRLWWEPWEISAGQTYAALERLDPVCVGLAIHSSIAEVQIALPADRWFKNIVNLANEKNIPVIAELWLGAATEEVETFISLPTPLATLRALRAVNEAGKLAGIKEYYGNIPDREDPNLRMTSIFFSNSYISDEQALIKLAKPYNRAANKMKSFWRYASEAVEMYPWDISWFAREVGRSDPQHLLSAATLKGASWETPSWQSNRRAAFMRTSETETPHFWMLEDAQLRFEATSRKINKALLVATDVRDQIPHNLLNDFDAGVRELYEFNRRVLAYAYHIRETNLCNIMRRSISATGTVKEENLIELKELLITDKQNQGEPNFLAQAIDLLNKDLNEFLKVYFNEPLKIEFVPHFYINDSLPPNVKTVWSITSQ